ncbi:MAG: hypothetical protein ABI745_08100 [Caldimonas sp.]
MSEPDRDDARDAWLSQALRHAPDADAAAPTALSDSILAKARAAAAPAPRPQARQTSIVDVLRSWWLALARPPVAAGFASVMAATLVGLMWWDRPMDETLPPPPSPSPSARTAPAAPPEVLEHKQVRAPAPAQTQAPAPARDSRQGAPATNRAAAPPAARKPEVPAPFPAGEARREVARAPVEEAKKAQAPSSFAAPSADAQSAQSAESTTAAAAAPPADAGLATGRVRSGATDRADKAMAKDDARSNEPAPAAAAAPRQRNAVDSRASADAVEREQAAPATSPLASLLASIAREPHRWARRSAAGDTAAIDAAWRDWLAEVDAAVAGRWQKVEASGAPGGGARDAAPLQILLDGRPAATVRLDGRTLRLDRPIGAAPGHWQATLAPDAAARLAGVRSRLPP